MADYLEKEEKKNKKIGIAVSLGLHALLLLIFALLLAWKEPNPPIPEYGIELNFGLDAQGSGNIQPQSPVDETSNTSEPEPTEELEEQAEEADMAEENTEEPAEATQPEVVEEVTSIPEQAEEASKAESPDVRKEEPAKVAEATPVAKEKPKEVAKKEVPVEQKTEAATEKASEKPAEKPAGGVPSDKVAESRSQGDNTDVPGDKGNKEGTVDARALYGTPGGGGGASLDLAGWAWEEVPRPKDTSNESGRLVFEITVDDNGEVIGIRTLERGVSAAVEAVYRQEVAKLYFRRSPPDSPAPPRSVGKITFIIKSR